jgi:hypothetical protein
MPVVLVILMCVVIVGLRGVLRDVLCGYVNTGKVRKTLEAAIVLSWGRYRARRRLDEHFPDQDCAGH